jgi:casein kinase II subunit alpha
MAAANAAGRPRRKSDATPAGPSEIERTYVHPYQTANDGKPKLVYDYENFKFEWASVEPYILHRKIGRGKYSEVFTATNRLNNQACVVKVLKPVKEKRLAREVLILENLCGVPNVIPLLDMVMDEATGTPALVFEHVRNIDHRQLYPEFTEMDVMYYMYELLRTLDLVHSMGVMHRDVKPHNICIDHRTRKLRLIDWGLAEFYHKGQQYNVRVASRHYKGPELLVGFRHYDYSLDIWSMGCILAAIIFKRDPFFHGDDNKHQLQLIVDMLGTDSLNEYISRLGLPANVVEEAIPANRPIPRRPWASLVSAKTTMATPLAIDLIDKILVMDHTKRLTARDAMAHGYFDAVRHFFPAPGVMQQALPKPATS